MRVPSPPVVASRPLLSGLRRWREVWRPYRKMRLVPLLPPPPSALMPKSSRKAFKRCRCSMWRGLDTVAVADSTPGGGVYEFCFSDFCNK